MNRETFFLKASPHAHAPGASASIMREVCIALLPATLWGFTWFGWPSVLLWLVTCASALLTEAACLRLRGLPARHLADSSALLTGWLLALTLPPWAPWWIGAGGAVFAIAVGKQVYGGLGQNLFNPALLARTALLLSFPVHMNTWPGVAPLGSPLAPDLLQGMDITFGSGVANLADGVTGASILGQMKAAASAGHPLATWLGAEFDAATHAHGITRGSLGETSEWLVLGGGVWLLVRRVITWPIPFSMLAGTGLTAWLCQTIDPAHHAGPLLHLTTGGLMLGAFFMATDYVTSPVTRSGQLLFGFGCGVMVYVIRSWGAFPEGVAFAILFMNALSPLLDRATRPRIYGRDRKGRPLPAVSTLKVKVK